MADIYAVGIAGSVVGVVVFGYLGDKFGRILFFWISTALIVISMELTSFVPDHFSAYAFLKFLGTSGLMVTYELPGNTLMEISSPKERSWISGFTWFWW